MSGGLTFGAAWPLLLLLIIPWLRWVQRTTLVDLSSRQLRLSGAVRSALVVVLALALSEPVIHRSGPWVSAIYLLDVSQSIAPAAIESAIQWIAQADATGRPAHARYVAFAANTAVVETVDRLRTVRIADTGDDAVNQCATSIERALESALQHFAPNHLKRLVLLTDGNENTGHMTLVLPRLASEGVRVYTVPLQARMSGDVWIEAIVVPPDVAPKQLFPLEVHVYSQRTTLADVQIRHGDTRLGSRGVQLVPGLNRVAFETSLEHEAGPVTLEAEVVGATQASPLLDSFPANNTFRASIVVTGMPKVLYVEGRPQSARYLQAALLTEGIAVTTLPPDRLPGDAAALDAYDAILLSDVPRRRLTGRQMGAIAAYVQDLGGGFILAGGENTYGAGDGYAMTDVEKILPITFDAKKPLRSVAMIVVLDKSGSMGGPEIGFAKEAAKAPLRLLRDTDTFGIVAFDSSFYWPVPLQSADNRDQIAQSINTVVAGGETNIFPALEAAYDRLAADSSEARHVILMSDGHTRPSDFEALVTKMAQAGITVSTVALGAAADRQLLEGIAESGKGRAYYLTDASRVPQIFTDETERTTGITLREAPFTPLVKKHVQAFKGIDFTAAPRLLGYVATKSKETSEVLLESSRGDPVLARWQYGLGKTAAFTSDLKDRWAVDWLRWSGYGKFWSQLVRETMRTRGSGDIDLRVARDGDRAKVTIDAITRNGRLRNRLESRLRVVGPDQSVSDVPIHQVGPGFYEAELALTQQGPYVVHMVGESEGPSHTLAYSYPDEYHFYPPDTEALRALSADTKGRFQPDARDIFDPRGETATVPTPLWPYLAALALALYMADVFLRRVRLFDPRL